MSTFYPIKRMALPDDVKQALTSNSFNTSSDVLKSDIFQIRDRCDLDLMIAQDVFACCAAIELPMDANAWSGYRRSLIPLQPRSEIPSFATLMVKLLSSNNIFRNLDSTDNGIFSPNTKSLIVNSIPVILGASSLVLGPGITEITCPKGSIESHLCHFVAAIASTSPEYGGSGANVLYFQSTPTKFRAIKAAQIMTSIISSYESLNKNPSENLKNFEDSEIQSAVYQGCANILALSTPTISEVIEKLTALEKEGSFSPNKQMIVVIDDISSMVENHFYDDPQMIVNRSTVAWQRQASLSNLACITQRLSEIFKVRFFIANPDGPSKFEDKNTSPLGLNWKYYVNTQMQIDCDKVGSNYGAFSVVLSKSPIFASSKTTFTIPDGQRFPHLPVVESHSLFETKILPKNHPNKD